MKISVSMIVKNEENYLRRALESVKEADEIIVCDTGSTDRTIEIAREYTDKVYTDYLWNDNFAEARNHAASKCTGDYILIIDADERLEAGAMDRLRTFDGLALNFHTVAENSGQVHMSIRLHKNIPEIFWAGAAHNYLNIEPSHQSNVKMYFGYSDSHAKDPDRTFRILKKHVKAHPLAKRERYYLGLEYVSRNMHKSAVRVLKRYVSLSTADAEKCDALMIIARCMYVQGNIEGSREAAIKAVTINPDCREAVELMGDVGEPHNRLIWHKLSAKCSNNNVLFIRERKKVVVTQLCEEDFAGSGFRIVKAVRSADPFDIDIEQIVLQKSAYDIPCGQTVLQLGLETVEDRISRSDIIHFKGDFAYNGEFHGFKIPERAKKIYTVGGSFFRRGGPEVVSMGDEPLENYRADYLTATTPDLCYTDDWYWAPFPCLEFNYLWKRGDHFRIVHVPSDKNKKNTDLLVEAIKILSRPDVELIMATGVTHQKSKELKRTATIYADQFLLPVYGNSAVEAMSYGVPVLSWTKDMYNEDCPVISPDELTAESLAGKIAEYLDWDKLEEVSKKTFEYVKLYHGRVGNFWANKYKQIIEPVVGVVIPTCNPDRKPMLDFVLERMNEQSRKPDHIIVVDYPNTGGVDITERMKKGLSEAWEKGCDFVLSIEDDDYYPITYVEDMLRSWIQKGRPPLIGHRQTINYNIFDSTYRVVDRDTFCSAFCTAFGRDVNFDIEDNIWDVEVWRKNPAGVMTTIDPPPVGIKHGIGMTGGHEHSTCSNKDDGTMLKKLVDKKALNFYSCFIDTI